MSIHYYYDRAKLHVRTFSASLPFVHHGTWVQLIQLSALLSHRSESTHSSKVHDSRTYFIDYITIMKSVISQSVYININ